MIRKANIQDVKSIHGLLQEYGKKEELLARPLSELYDHIRDFSVYMDESNHQLIGCCALQFCWEDLAEIRSLAVLPEHLGKNIGTKLAETVLQEAKSFNVKFGFIQIERSDLPLKIWGDCIICIKFPDCDEIAMMKEL